MIADGRYSRSAPDAAPAAALGRVDLAPLAGPRADRPTLLTEGACWRRARATRANVLIDVQDYFRAAKAALKSARSTIHLLNWAFDPDTLLDPRPGGVGAPEDRIGAYLKALLKARPELDIRILCWKSALAVSATQRFFPHRAKACFAGSGVRFLLDATVPLGACHHQKIMVIDDRLAFCGGADICPDRWDTAAHLDEDSRRETGPYSSKDFPSRHEVIWRVEGPIAAALGELFRERWRRATNTSPPAGRLPTGGEDAQPSQEPGALAEFANVDAALSRTEPAWREAPEVRECETLHLAAIAAARRCIYLENQYITAPGIADALAARLSEPDGPEVILISTAHSPSWFDRMTMDRTRSNFLRRLQGADAFGRLHAYVPRTDRGRFIIVHAKVSIMDDTLLRVGSANLNNRSGGFDTECDLSIEASPDDRRARVAIANVRARLVAHWLGCGVDRLEAAAEVAGGLGGAIERLRAAGHDRLAPLRPEAVGPLGAFVASFHLGDPCAPSDSWRPWRRKSALQQRQGRAAKVRAPVSASA